MGMQHIQLQPVIPEPVTPPQRPDRNPLPGCLLQRPAEPAEIEGPIGICEDAGEEDVLAERHGITHMVEVGVGDDEGVQASDTFLLEVRQKPPSHQVIAPLPPADPCIH